MTWYIATWENKKHREKGLSSGVVLGVVTATNPEEAMIQICDRVLNQEVIEELTPAGRVAFATYILETQEEPEDRRDYKVRIYRLAEDEEGRPDIYDQSSLDIR